MRLHRAALLFALSGFLAACSGSDSPTEPARPPTPVPTTVSLSPATVSFVSLGATQQLSAVVRDQTGATMSGVSIAWGSSAPQVASVSSSGLVTAVENGSASVSATAGSVSASVTVVVAQQPAQVSADGGNGQSGLRGMPLGDSVRVRVTDANGRGVPNVQVTWAVTGGGGSLSQTGSTTGAAGYAAARWTLGAQAGLNTVEARAAGVASPIGFQATARNPRWTVMVYLAADNNLSTQGYYDLEEMEAAGYDPEVQVVVQGEFNPLYMLLDGFNPGNVGLSQFTTFRYALGPNQQRFPGLDGSPEILGPTDMTSPQTLASFVNWARSKYPAERYILIPWNHGAGFSGLIQDMTQAGNDLMSLSEFRQALLSVEKVDIIDFDMCLMGGYETLAQLFGRADIGIFSEELVPGEGLPYKAIIDRLQAAPTASTRDVARMMVDEYSKHFDGGRASTTKSAFDLAGFDRLDEAVTQLAAALGTGDLQAIRSDLVNALRGSQSFAEATLKDIVDFATVYKTLGAPAALVPKLDAVVSAATATDFRLTTKSYSSAQDRDVSRATGLHFVFPSGADEDRFDSSGRRSLSHYQSVMPQSPWASFLASWTQAIQAAPTVDLGPGNALEIYEVWDTATVRVGGDVDFWLWEPDGRSWSPWKGTRTTNGLFSADSWESTPPAYYEAWLSNRVVQVGKYLIYAHQWRAPAGHQTYLDVAYRFNLSQDFTYLYRDTPTKYVSLSQAKRIEDDPTPTLGEADGGAYSNFKAVAVWSPGSAAQLASPAEVPWAADVLPNTEDIDRLRALISARRTARGDTPSGAPWSPRVLPQPVRR